MRLSFSPRSILDKAIVLDKTRLVTQKVVIQSAFVTFDQCFTLNTVDECLTVFILFSFVSLANKRSSSNLSLVIFARAFKQCFTGFFPM